MTFRVILVVALVYDTWYVTVLLVRGWTIHLWELLTISSCVYLWYSGDCRTLWHWNVIIFL